MTETVTQSSTGSDEVLNALIGRWMMEARRLEAAAREDDIGDEESALNKFVAERLRKCMSDVEILRPLIVAQEPAASTTAEELIRRFEYESMALHKTQREWLVREIGLAQSAMKWELSAETKAIIADIEANIRNALANISTLSAGDRE